MVSAVVPLQVPVLRTTTTITGIRIRMSALTYAKKNIAILNIITIFALALHTQGRYKVHTTTFLKNGLGPPCGALMCPLPLRCNATGKAEPFFFSNSALIKFNSVMRYTEKKKPSKKGIEALKAQHTLNRETVIQLISSRSITQLVSDYLMEKDLKNEAYYFILERGHYDDFSEYCKNKKS